MYNDINSQFTHIQPFYDLENKKIISYGNKNINKSFVLYIGDFMKIKAGYDVRLKLHELIPKFKKGRTLDFYRDIKYYEFNRILNEIASINLLTVDNENIPKNIIDGTPFSFLDVCSIM